MKKRGIAVSILFLVCGILIVLPAGCGLHGKGKKLYENNRCRECHTINGTGGSAGPNLTFVGSRRSREFIMQQIKNPKKNNANTNMPSFGNLSDEDAAALVDYLSSLK